MTRRDEDSVAAARDGSLEMDDSTPTDESWRERATMLVTNNPPETQCASLRRLDRVKD
jgi:hypothetical protein